MIGLDLTEFIQHIKRDGIARPNRYSVVFTLPEALSTVLTVDPLDTSFQTDLLATGNGQNNQGNPVGIARSLSLSCLTVDIPEVGVNVTGNIYGNYERRMATDRTIGSFTTTFILTGKMQEKVLFDAWQDILLDKTKHRVKYYDDYISNITVSTLNNAEEETYKFEVLEAYPIQVGQIRLDRTSINTQMLLDVTWNYWKVSHNDDEYQLNKDIMNQQKYDSGIYIDPTAQKLNIKNVPTKYYAQIQANDLIKAARRIHDALKRGDMTPASAIALLRQITMQFKSLTGIPKDVTDEIEGTVQDVLQGMPIPFPGIPGGIPQRLPF